MFSFKKDNTLPYYTNVDMSSSNSSFNTRSSVYNKLKCFKHALTRDEYYFQYAGTHDLNLLPNNITALITLPILSHRSIFIVTDMFNLLCLVF